MSYAEKFYLVPTRCVGIHTDRAAVYYSTRRVDTAFPRSAWERENDKKLESKIMIFDS
jgi:hypothetical protein